MQASKLELFTEAKMPVDFAIVEKKRNCTFTFFASRHKEHKHMIKLVNYHRSKFRNDIS